jgi:uncharacterized membrane protein
MSTPDETHSEKETGRVEAFSDGVFAIAITLLVLEIPIQHPTAGIDGTHAGGVLPGQLAQAVLHQWPNFLAYVVSFVVILVMWLNHHAIFQMVHYIDRPFMALNGFLLLLVTFINYPTALVADFLGTPDARFAVSFYSGVFVVITAVYYALWHRAADGHRLIGKDIDPAEVARLSAQYRFGPAIYVVAFIISFINGWVGLAMQGLLALYFAFTGRLGNTRAQRRKDAKATAPPVSA